MSHQEILEKAIQKAIDGGWSDGKHYLSYAGSYQWVDDKVNGTGWSDYEDWRPVQEFLFNHDFAKALWGDAKMEELAEKHGMDLFPWWQYHLQQMVIADDPIEYLGANV